MKHGPLWGLCCNNRDKQRSLCCSNRDKKGSLCCSNREKLRRYEIGDIRYTKYEYESDYNETVLNKKLEIERDQQERLASFERRVAPNQANLLVDKDQQIAAQEELERQARDIEAKREQ